MGLFKERKKKRTLYFNKTKHWIKEEGEDTFYTEVNDNKIMESIIHFSKNLDFEIIEVYLDDNCWNGRRNITVKATKQNFLTFVAEFISKFEKDIEDVNFTLE